MMVFLYLLSLCHELFHQSLHVFLTGTADRSGTGGLLYFRQSAGTGIYRIFDHTVGDAHTVADYFVHIHIITPSFHR